MKKSKTIIITLVIICTIISCSKNGEEVIMKNETALEDGLSDQVLNEETLVQYSGNDVTYHLLKAIKVSGITCQGENRYMVSLFRGDTYSVTIDDLRKTLSVFTNNNDYQVVFQEDRLIVHELPTNRSTTYSILEGTGSELDPIIAVAVAAKVYQQDVGNMPYHINHEDLLFQTESYLCMHPRKSWCSAERMAATLEDYCGGAPAFVGGTDCGCLWGDFFCICITDFEC